MGAGAGGWAAALAAAAKDAGVAETVAEGGEDVAGGHAMSDLGVM